MMTPLDQFGFHHTLAGTPGTALVIFTAAGCGSCRVMRRAMTEFGASHPGITLFEVDAQRDMALTREFEVFHLPAVFLFRDGEFHGAIQCDPHAPGIERAVAEAMLSPPGEAP